MKTVTLWFKKGKDGWEFNHLEDGFTGNSKPTIKHPAQKAAWSTGQWLAKKAELTDDIPPKVVNIEENQ